MHWLALGHVCTPKRSIGAAILDLYENTVASIFSFLKVMFEREQPYTKIFAYVIEKKGIKDGKSKIAASCWHENRRSTWGMHM